MGKADSIQFEILGFQELLEDMKHLPDNVKQNGVNTTFRKESKAIKDLAQSLVRKETGRLSDSIQSKKRRTKSKNFFKYTIGAKLGENRKDKDGAFYAPFIEFKTSRIPEKSYLREALSQRTNSTVNEITKNLKIELEKAVVRANKKAAKGKTK